MHMCVDVHAGVSACMCTCRVQRLAPGIFRYHSTLLEQNQGLLLNLEIHLSWIFEGIIFCEE